jgi:hypothetical protein
MKARPWQVRSTSLLFLIFVLVPALGQVQAPASSAINQALDINSNLVPLPLNDKVNSDYVEAGPLISADGKRLYYSRFGHPSNTGGVDDTDIWYNQFDDSTQSWSESKNIGPPLNNKGPNFVCELGWSDDTLMVANRYGKRGKMRAGVSISVWDGNAWSAPSPIEVKNDYNMAENVGYDLSSYRNVLIITEEKIDSQGKTDLYVAFRDRAAARTTTESFNLGAVINSPGSERSPFLTDDTKTLYFASDGHSGYGKLDIYRSHRLDDTWTNWSKPENLGPGINTPFDDRNFSFGSTSRYAYYSRGISDSRSDIYCFPLSSLFTPAASAIKDLNESNTTTEAGKTFILKDAFGAGQSVLTDSALMQLKYMVTYMERLKDPVLFISTHSNNHTNRAQSLALSNQRLQEVQKYLIAGGIAGHRIQGESNGHDVAASDATKYLANSLEFKFINKVIIRTAPPVGN